MVRHVRECMGRTGTASFRLPGGFATVPQRPVGRASKGLSLHSSKCARSVTWHVRSDNLAAMNRPLASLLLLIAALAAIVWFVMGGSNGLQPEPAPTSAEVADSLEDVGALEGHSAEESAATNALQHSGLERSALPGTGAAVLPDADFGEVRIQVVDAKYKRPVHGATVWLLNRNLSEGSGMIERLALAKGVEALLNEISESGRTNQDGIVVLPFFGGEVKVGALHGDSFAFTTRQLGGEDPVVVELRPALHVPVKVVDTEGKPVAGAPVSLRLSFGGEWRIDLLHTNTDANGIALLKNVGLFKEEGDLQAALFVALPLPLPEPVEVQIPFPKQEQERFDFAWPQNMAPLVLTKPDTGTVDVYLHDTDGQPFLGSAPVFLYLKSNIGDDPKKQEERKRQAVRAAVTAVDGVAHFPWSALGEEVVAECNFGGDTQRSSTTAAGPSSKEVPARVELFQSQGRAMVRGQLLLADGSPLPQQTVEAVIHANHPGNMNEHRVPVMVGENGYFNFSIYPIPRRALMTADLVFRITHDRRLLFASASLPLPLSTGSFDCGALELGEAPLIISGTVLRPDGTPAIGLELRVEVKLLRGENPRWRQDRSLRTATHSDGRFRISGLALDGRYRLKMTPYYALPYSREFALGTRDLEILLTATRKLVGRVLTENFIGRNDITAVVTFPDVFADTQEDSYAKKSARVFDREFELRNLPLTPVDLEFHLERTNEVIAVIPGLQPDMSGAKFHPRLDPVDLRGRIFHYEFRARDSAGKPIRNFTVTWSMGDKRGQVNTQSSVAKVLTTLPSLDVTILSTHYRSLRVNDIHSDTEVVLRAPLAIGIRYAPATPLPRGYRLGMTLQPTFGPLVGQRSRGAQFQDQERATLKLSEAGKFLIMPYLIATDDPRNQKIWVRASRTIQVLDQPGQTFDFSLSNEQMEEAIRLHHTPR